MHHTQRAGVTDISFRDHFDMTGRRAPLTAYNSARHLEARLNERSGRLPWLLFGLFFLLDFSASPQRTQWHSTHLQHLVTTVFIFLQHFGTASHTSRRMHFQLSFQ